MATEGMLRGQGARATRDQRDIATDQEAMRSARDNGGSIAQFYDELGFTTTPDLYEKIMADEQSYNKEMSSYRDRVATAEGEYAKANQQYAIDQKKLEDANKKIPALNKAIDDSWKQYKRDLLPIRVVGPNDKIEGTYYLPKDVADGLMGKRGIFASYQDNNKTFNVMAKNYRNQEIHDMLREGQQSLESNYRANASKQIAPQIVEAKKSILEGQTAMAQTGGQLANYKTEIDSTTTMLDQTQAARDEQWASMRQSYQDKMKTMNEVLGGLNFV